MVLRVSNFPCCFVCCMCWPVQVATSWGLRTSSRSLIPDFDPDTRQHLRQNKNMYGNTSVQLLEFEVLRQRQELVEMQELLDMREEEVRCVILFLCVCVACRHHYTSLLLVAVRVSHILKCTCTQLFTLLTVDARFGISTLFCPMQIKTLARELSAANSSNATNSSLPYLLRHKDRAWPPDADAAI